MRIIFMGTPEIGVESLKRLNEEHEISLVITQPDRPKGRGKKLQSSPVKDTALELNIPVFQPEKVNSEEALLKIKEINPDIIVVIAYGQILSEEFLKIPKFTINLHASLLPKYRGASPIQTAIAEGEEITGITVMEVQKGLDSGDMLIKEEIPVGDKDALKLSEEMGIKGADLLSKVLRDFDFYYSKKLSQDESEATFCKKIKKEDGKIIWSESAKKIRQKIRGLKPFPICFTSYNGINFKIHEAYDIPGDKGASGEIIKADSTGIFVQTGDGILKITELQIPGKRKMSVKDFLLGNKIDTGEKFI